MGINITNDDFKLEPNETEKHFIWRVYKYMEDTGNINQEQAGEICNRELRVDYDESRHRKIYQSFSSMWKEVKDEYVQDDSLRERLDAIDQREDELYKAKVRAWDAVRTKRSTLRDEARIEEVFDYIVEVAKTITPYRFIERDLKLCGSDTGILQLSDWHMGEVYKNFWGSFSPEELVDKVTDLIHRTVLHCDRNNIGTLYVCSLGDMISGNIHVSARVADTLDAIEQTMKVSELMTFLLHTLSEYGLQIKYISTLDNHSRLNKNYKEHIEKESFAKLMDWYILGRITDNPKYENIEVISNIIDDNIGYFKIDDKVFYCVHGHLDNPRTVIEDLSMSVGIKADYVLMGHYHSFTANEKYFAKCIINGSMSGVGEYAKNKRLFSNSSQNLIMFCDNDDVIINMKFNSKPNNKNKLLELG